MEKLKLGVLGLSGHFVKRVFFPLRKAKNIQIYGIASRNPEKARSFSEKYGIKKWYGSYEELLEDRDIDLVYIPLPNHLHLEYIKKSADMGKHILCEKPLTLNYKEAVEAIEYAHKKGVLLMEAFMYKFHPQWIKTKEIVERGELGEIQTIYCYFSYNNPDPKNYRNHPEYGGGVLLDIGVYAISSARFLLEKEPEKVLSIIEREKFGIDTLTSGMLYFGKARSLFTVSGLTFPWQGIEVYGTEGTLFIEIPFNPYPDVPGHIKVTTYIGTRDIYPGPEDHYLLEFEYFGEAIKKGESLEKLNKDTLNNMKIIDALFRSHEEGGWISLNE